MRPVFRDGVWFVDFEFSREEDREPPAIVCMTAKERGGHEIRMFRENRKLRAVVALQTGNVMPTSRNYCGLMRMDVSLILFRSTHR